MTKEMQKVEKKSPWTQEQIKLITNTVAKGATPDELKLFLYTASRTGLDPLTKQIHFVKRGGQMTIQTGIDGYRVIAERSGTLAGIDDAIYDSEDGAHPNKATVTVWRIIEGIKVSFTASARWSEYAPQGNQAFMWGKMPYLMLAKCFTDGAEILTTDGFKEFKELTPDDLVAQVDEVGALTFVQPTAYIEKDVDEDIVASTSNRIKFEVTKDHRVVTTDGIVEANELLTMTTRDNFDIPRTVTYRGSSLTPPEIMTLLGYFMADGSADNYRSFRISVSRPDKIAALEKLGLHYNKYNTKIYPPQKTPKTVFSYHKELLRDFVSWDGDKTLDMNFMLEVDQPRIKAFVDAWADFDGVLISTNNQKRVYTSREHHVRYLETFGVLAGYSVRYEGSRNSRWSTKPNHILTLNNVPTATVRKEMVETRRYTGPVYCVTVPTGRILVRHGGYSFITGNCAEALALRKAFPNDLSGLYTNEEMAQADNQVTYSHASEPRPETNTVNMENPVQKDFGETIDGEVVYEPVKENSGYETKKICDFCGREHTGKWNKCLDCWKEEKNTGVTKQKIATKTITNPSEPPF